METFAARNGRRQVFYAVPGGAAPLTGLLSLVEPEETDGPEFSWTEQRWREKVLTTVTTGAVFAAAGSSTASDPQVAAVGTAVRIYVTASETSSNWQIGERVIVQSFKQGTSFVDAHGVISDIGTWADTANSYVEVKFDSAVSFINPSSAAPNAGRVIMSLGLPNSEGSLSSAARRSTWPIDVYNYTEVFRRKFGFSRTALNQPMFFDKNGKYQSDARDAAVAHMVEIENSLLFGQRAKTTSDDANFTGTPTIKRTMGGILWYLTEYEKANGGVFKYRDGSAAVTANSSDDKLIIDGSASTGAGATITVADWESYEERMFRTTMTSSYEKLLIGGSAFCAAVLKYYEGKVQINRNSMMDENKLQFSFSTVETRNGILHVKSHPRFNALSALRSNGFVLDLANLKFRPMRGADTHLREEVQPNDFDGRMDEYLTEGSLEFRFPESCMYFKNINKISG